MQIAAIVAIVRDVLERDLVGAYLFGSAVVGGLKPRSDIDVLAVSTRPAADEDRRRLVASLLEISGARAPDPGRPVELTIVVDSEIRPWRYPPRRDFQYGDWLRDEFEAGDLRPAESRADPDLALLISMAVLASRPLAGPPAAGVFDAVPADDITRATLAGIDSLLADLEGDTRNVILTLARSWCTVCTGSIRSKDEAATWALERVPPEHRAVLARAREIYLGHEEERWADLAPEVTSCVSLLVERIREDAETFER